MKAACARCNSSQVAYRPTTEYPGELVYVHHRVYNIWAKLYVFFIFIFGCRVCAIVCYVLIFSCIYPHRGCIIAHIGCIIPDKGCMLPHTGRRETIDIYGRFGALRRGCGACAPHPRRKMRRIAPACGAQGLWHTPQKLHYSPHRLHYTRQGLHATPHWPQRNNRYLRSFWRIAPRVRRMCAAPAAQDAAHRPRMWGPGAVTYPTEAAL